VSCAHVWSKGDEFPFRWFCVKCLRNRIDVREEIKRKIQNRIDVREEIKRKRADLERDAKRWRAILALIDTSEDLRTAVLSVQKAIK
jgi:hypothetical protein